MPDVWRTFSSGVLRTHITDADRVAMYAPQTVRKSLTGDGWASKRELARAVASRFPALRVYLTQDRKWKERYFLNLFDAVALALHHQRTT
jgi:Holliday junction resolvasome RuvABC endonuclease subunit